MMGVSSGPRRADESTAAAMTWIAMAVELQREIIRRGIQLLTPDVWARAERATTENEGE